jgi:hypothetical protein
MLKLSIQCTTFESDYSVCTSRSSENICSSKSRRSGKRRDWMKLSLPPKLVENLVWVPVISLCKIFIRSYMFDALLCHNWPFSPPNHRTLRITLLCLGILVIGFRVANSYQVNWVHEFFQYMII